MKDFLDPLGDLEGVLSCVSQAMKTTDLEGACSCLVIATDYWHNEFLVARGKREAQGDIVTEEEVGTPEASYKNFGGGLSVDSVRRYLEGNPEFIAQISLITLRNPVTLMKLGLVAEMFEETGYSIPPNEFGRIFLIFVRHIRDRKSPGRVHLDYFFGTDLTLRPDKVKIDTSEINDFDVVSVQRKDDGPQMGRRIRVAYHHETAIMKVYAKIHDGAEIDVGSVICGLGNECRVCNATPSTSSVVVRETARSPRLKKTIRNNTDTPQEKKLLCRADTALKRLEALKDKYKVDRSA